MTDYISNIKENIFSFNPISLEEMDAVKLMNRMDNKFALPFNLLPEILQNANEFYKVLTINNERIFQYETSYFDTCDNRLYLDHQNGKLNRYKIRHRKYINTGTGFLEIKFKSNKNRTIKKRIKCPNESLQDEKQKHFIESICNIPSNLLQLKVINNFNRITLVHNKVEERITIDFSLAFEIKENGKIIDLPYLCIAEIKQNKSSNNSDLVNILRSQKIRPTGISKYCIGSALLNPCLKSNRFKEKIMNLEKIKTIYNKSLLNI